MLTRKTEGSTNYFYEGNMLVLTVDEKMIESGLLMTLAGKLRTDAAHFIQDELDAFVTLGIKVLVDLKDVTFITPAVLHAFLSTQQNIDILGKGELRLRNIPEQVLAEMDKVAINAELLMIDDWS